jgi:hypothetical protein
MTTIFAVLVPFNETKPLESLSIAQSPDEAIESCVIEYQEHGIPVEDVRQMLLLRPSPRGDAGLYAYDIVTEQEKQQHIRNIRATRLAMACGLFSRKLFGNVLLIRSTVRCRENLRVEDVYGACCSADLRPDIQRELCTTSEKLTACQVPSWLGNALQDNYHDSAVLDKLADVMATNSIDSDGSNSDTESHGDSSDEGKGPKESASKKLVIAQPPSEQQATEPVGQKQTVTRQPLCIHCRRPASTLCSGCNACYFCEPPRSCREMGYVAYTLISCYILHFRQLVPKLSMGFLSTSVEPHWKLNVY